MGFQAVQPVSAYMGIRSHGFFQQKIIVRKPGSGIFPVPQMITHGPERMIFANQAVFEQPDDKFGIFPSPPLKIMVESVHRNHIGFKFIPGNMESRRMWWALPSFAVTAYRTRRPNERVSVTANFGVSSFSTRIRFP